MVQGTRDAVFASFFLESADTAWAQSGPLDQIGGVCVPDGATIRAGLYETRGFGVGFSGSQKVAYQAGACDPLIER